MASSLWETHRLRWGAKPPTSIDGLHGGKGQFDPQDLAWEKTLINIMCGCQKLLQAKAAPLKALGAALALVLVVAFWGVTWTMARKRAMENHSVMG